jgi:hypothetical protein
MLVSMTCLPMQFSWQQEDDIEGRVWIRGELHAP